MRPVRAKITIHRPVEEVFDYLLDIGSRPEFAPTLFLDFRLTRVESYGVGAGARYRLHRKLRDRFAGSTIVEAKPFERIFEEGSTGRAGRVPLAIEYLFEQQSDEVTIVTMMFETHPLNLADQIREFRFRSHLKSRVPRSLKRLRDILEGAPGAAKGDRPTVGGMDNLYVPNP